MIRVLISLFFIPVFFLSSETVQQSYRTKIITSYTYAAAKIDLISEVSSHVTQVNYNEGEIISDKPFCVLEPTWIDLKIKNNEAQINQTQSQFQYWNKELDRMKKLKEVNQISQSQLDQTKKEFDRYQQALKILNVESNRLSELKKRHQITGIKNWHVIKKWVEPHSYVSQGQKVAQIASYQILKIDFALSQNEKEYVISQKKSLQLKKLDGTLLSVNIDSLDPTYHPDTKKFHITLSLENSQMNMWGGIPLELQVSIPDEAGLFMIPSEYVQNDYDQTVLIDSLDQIHNISIVWQDDQRTHFYSDTLRTGIEVK